MSLKYIAYNLSTCWFFFSSTRMWPNNCLRFTTKYETVQHLQACISCTFWRHVAKYSLDITSCVRSTFVNLKKNVPRVEATHRKLLDIAIFRSPDNILALFSLFYRYLVRLRNGARCYGSFILMERKKDVEQSASKRCENHHHNTHSPTHKITSNELRFYYRWRHFRINILGNAELKSSKHFQWHIGAMLGSRCIIDCCFCIYLKLPSGQSKSVFIKTLAIYFFFLFLLNFCFWHYCLNRTSLFGAFYMPRFSQ